MSDHKMSDKLPDKLHRYNNRGMFRVSQVVLLMSNDRFKSRTFIGNTDFQEKHLEQDPTVVQTYSNHLIFGFVLTKTDRPMSIEYSDFRISDHKLQLNL